MACSDAALEKVQELHAAVDRLAAQLEDIHASRLKCGRGCFGCCIDGLSIFEIEAERIRRNCQDLLREERPHPPGVCAFLGHQGECRIYEHRPYLCRTQGLPLRWTNESDQGSPIEYRDICPLNLEGEPIEFLPPEQCWTIGPFERRLAAIQEGEDGGELRRIRLRDLFRPEEAE